MLSYAGRLQLIDSVLSSMQVYWVAVYLIPKTTMMDINFILRSFLWKSSDNCKGKAKDVETDKEDSWGWKNLMEIRDNVKDKIVQVLWNGENTSMFKNLHIFLLVDKVYPLTPATINMMLERKISAVSDEVKKTD
nr:reverse transcriptase domain, reverse transcriptase zinc-binding domain protein [Tanacetum cinerariifolium]